MVDYAEMFAGWWYCVGPTGEPQQFYGTDDEYRKLSLRPDVTYPQPTREHAIEIRDWDEVPRWFEAGMAVYADHCPKCGRWAQVLAGSYKFGFDWRVTDCRQCGIIDSRVEN